MWILVFTLLRRLFVWCLCEVCFIQHAVPDEVWWKYDNCTFFAIWEYHRFLFLFFVCLFFSAKAFTRAHSVPSHSSDSSASVFVKWFIITPRFSSVVFNWSYHVCLFFTPSNYKVLVFSLCPISILAHTTKVVIWMCWWTKSVHNPHVQCMADKTLCWNIKIKWPACHLFQLFSVTNSLGICAIHGLCNAMEGLRFRD